MFLTYWPLIINMRYDKDNDVRKVHKVNDILYISTPWKCKMEHLDNVKRVSHRHEDPRDCSGRGNTGRSTVYLDIYWLSTERPVPA